MITVPVQPNSILLVKDGMGDQRRTRRFDKATHGLSRLLVIGSTGFVTLDALHWLRRLGIGALVLAPDGTVALASTPRMTEDARLRRIQAAVPELPAGLGIAQSLMAAKLNGQAALVRSRFSDVTAADTLESLAAAVEVADDIDEVRRLESTAAALYWQTWSARPATAPRFRARDRPRVPPQWMAPFQTRRSPLRSANGNSKAATVVNAVFNYLYAIAEAESILACHAVGLDPGLGLVHLDARSRPSFALDLIEPIRPLVDAYVLDVLAARTFRKVEFVEATDGWLRMRAPLTHELAESVPKWSKAIAPWAERVAHMLGQRMAGQYEPATPLTRTLTKAAQARVRTRTITMSSVARSSTPRQAPGTPSAHVPYACPDCGSPVANARRLRCDACIEADPRETPALRANRARAISARRQREAKWAAINDGAPVSPEWAAEVLRPALAAVKLSAVVEACGVTKSTASSWRNGKTAPHPMHIAALSRLAGVDMPSGTAQ